jgi:hypothetical protein
MLSFGLYAGLDVPHNVVRQAEHTLSVSRRRIRSQLFEEEYHSYHGRGAPLTRPQQSGVAPGSMPGVVRLAAMDP